MFPELLVVAALSGTSLKQSLRPVLPSVSPQEDLLLNGSLLPVTCLLM